MWTPGFWEILLILFVVLLIFGPKKLPELAKGLGRSMREFRKATREIQEDIEAAGEEPAGKSGAGSPEEKK